MEVASPIPKKKARIEIIPLIDIMFFLLASFMMVSLSQTTMKGMKVALPTGASGKTQSKKDYVSLYESRGEDFYPRRPGRGSRQRHSRVGSDSFVGFHQDIVRNQEPGFGGYSRSR